MLVQSGQLRAKGLICWTKQNQCMLFGRIENPRVGGSIPPQATIQINGLHVFAHCKPLCFV